MFEFALLVNFNPLQVECPQCHQSVNLKHLAEMVIRHQNHNPRTGDAPPSTSVTPFPNPKYSDIPFPHEDDHVLMMHLIPSLQDEDPRLTEIFMNMQSPKDKHGLGYYNQKDFLIPECRFKDFPEDVKRPSVPEIQKFYTLMDGCKKHKIPAQWMKQMINWDFFTHPETDEFAVSHPPEQKKALALEWK